MAILQHVIDFKNGPGLQKLVAEFNISAAQIERIVGLIADEKQYPCTSFSRNTELAIDENWADVWKTEYVPIVNQVVKRKASILSRFIEWIKRIFRGKRT
jgi:hypothetical protein